MEAKHYFEKAVNFERKGDMKNAIQNYKRAMKLDSEVEFKFYAETKSIKTLALGEQAQSRAGEQAISTEKANINEETEIVDVSNIIQDSPLLRLPNDVLVHILKWATINNYGGNYVAIPLICRKISILCKEQSIWKFQCEEFHRPKVNVALSILNQQYPNYFEMFLCKPRVRFDGCYISKIKYLRPGITQELSYMQPLHLVIYYRYIRFISHNTFLIANTPEEPVAMVKNMIVGGIKVLEGRYSWSEDGQKISLSWIHGKDRYVAQFKVASKFRGRHDKLKWGNV